MKKVTFFLIVVLLLLCVSCKQDVGQNRGISVYKNFDSIGDGKKSVKAEGMVVGEPVKALQIHSFDSFQRLVNLREDFRNSTTFDVSAINGDNLSLIYVGDEHYGEWFDNWQLGTNYLLVVPNVVSNIYKEATGQTFTSLASAYSFYWYMYTYYGFDNPNNGEGWSEIIDFFAKKDRIVSPRIEDLTKKWKIENPVVLERMSWNDNPVDNFGLDEEGKILMPVSLLDYYESQSGRCDYSTMFIWAMDAYFGLNETQIEKMIRDGSYKSFINNIAISEDFLDGAFEKKPVAKKYKDRVITNPADMPSFEVAAMTNMLISYVYAPGVLVKQGSAGEKVEDNTKIYVGGTQFPSGAYYTLSFYIPKALADYVNANVEQYNNIFRKTTVFLKSLNQQDLNELLIHDSMTDLETCDFCRVISKYSFDFTGNTKTVYREGTPIWTNSVD